MKLKVCGMTDPENIKTIAELNPDYLGFIFYEKSTRFFDGKIPDLPKHIKKVGVFVDANISDVKSRIEKHNLNAIQLHGNESPEYCSKLKALEIEIIKAFSIYDSFDFSKLKPYETICDYFLFDTKGKLPGGNGFTFNWNILNKYPSTKPFFLSGGIGLKETQELQSFLKTDASTYCYAIDVNSKFEIKPGLKNHKDLKQFMYELQH